MKSKTNRVSKYFSVGDSVKIISGKEKGKTSVIKTIFRDKGVLILENINLKKVHLKPRNSEESGRVEQKELPISASNVSFYLGTDMKASKAFFLREKGRKTQKIMKAKK